MADTYDLIVLGSGPGGYVAAIRASQLGLKVAIVERENLGGICLNWGCIPTKALLRSAEVFHNMKHADAYGLDRGRSRASTSPRSWRAAAAWRSSSTPGVTGLMKKNKIAVHMGDGALTAPGKLTVTKDGKATELAAKHIIVATGARARDLPFAKADGERIWTYRHAMVPKAMPTELLVIGSGAIGIEFASFYNDLGAKVTVVEMLDRIVPVEDKDVVRRARQVADQAGHDDPHRRRGREPQGRRPRASRRRSRPPTARPPSSASATASSRSGSSPTPRISGSTSSASTMDRGFLKTDPMCRTNVPGIWAIGDITAPPWLAHKASHEGVIAAEAIAQALGNKDAHPHAMDPRNIPGCTYCHPQVA